MEMTVLADPKTVLGTLQGQATPNSGSSSPNDTPRSSVSLGSLQTKTILSLSLLLKCNAEKLMRKICLPVKCNLLTLS